MLINTDILTLSELQSLTTAFNNFTTISNSTLPDYYKQHFPHTCECGGEIIISNEYTRLQCCNPTCFIKQYHRLADFTKRLGYLGFGVANAEILVRQTKSKWQYNSYLSTFLLDDEIITSALGIAAAQNFINIRNSIKTSKFNLIDALYSLSIIGIGKTSPLFNRVKTIQVILESLLNDTTDNLCEQCRIFDPLVKYGLVAAKLDIFIAFKLIFGQVTDLPLSEIHLAITGIVTINGEPLTRNEFIRKCEAITDKDGCPLYHLKETKATRSIQCVIADEPSNSSKYKLGKSLNILITGQDFYNLLLSSKGVQTNE